VARDGYAGNVRSLTPPPNAALDPGEIQQSLGALHYSYPAKLTLQAILAD
jgi:hypothetical protein